MQNLVPSLLGRRGLTEHKRSTARSDVDSQHFSSLLKIPKCFRTAYTACKQACSLERKWLYSCVARLIKNYKNNDNDNNKSNYNATKALLLNAHDDNKNKCTLWDNEALLGYLCYFWSTGTRISAVLPHRSHNKSNMSYGGRPAKYHDSTVSYSLLNSSICLIYVLIVYLTI